MSMQNLAAADNMYSETDGNVQHKTNQIGKHREDATSSSSAEFKYEELHDGLACPTCRGTGKIPRGQEDELVALIPYSDKRLQPRRTTLYVSIAILICLAIAGLLIFFLFPREISLLAGKVQTEDVKLNTTIGHEYLWLHLKNSFNITNNNFVQATIDQLTLQALYRDTIVGSSVSTPTTTIDPRKSVQIFTDVNVTFSGTEAVIVTFVCDPKRQISHNLYFKFQATLQTSFLSHSEESTVTSELFTSCVLQTDYR